MRAGHCRDHAREDQRGRPVAHVEPLRRQVARCRAQCEREQNRQPVERFAAGRVDRVDGKGSLARIPRRENRGKRDREDNGRRDERYACVVREVVGDLRTHDADQDDTEPVDSRDVLRRPELEDECGDQQRNRDERRLGQAEVEIPGEVVGGSLTDRRAQDLDHPEVDRDFWNLVQHLPAAQANAVLPRRHRARLPSAI